MIRGPGQGADQGDSGTENRAKPAPRSSSAVFTTAVLLRGPVARDLYLRPQPPARGPGRTGPAIIGEMDSTTVVLPGFDARVDAVGNLLINPVRWGLRP